MPSLLSAGLALGLGLGLNLTGGIADAAQARTGSIRVEVVEAAMPVAGATVSAGGRSAATDASGVTTLTLPQGTVSVLATKDGYEPATARVDVVAGGERGVRLVLTAKPTGQDQATVVSTTRNGQPIEEQAVPVEVLGRDRIEENMLITPGNIVRSLDEMSGLRVQTTSPELGTAVVRIRGLRGQYTRLLSDGVPLYFEHPGGLALVQIPPMDLDRVEVLKGGASAFFGGSAIGVVNLLSRRPGKERDREFLFSQSTRGGTDGVLWMSSPPAGSWSNTFLASAHSQNETDVDHDGWSDLPGYKRVVARPRVFWDNGQGRSGSGTAGVVFETREGGSAIAHQSLESRSADGTLSYQRPLGRYVLAGTSMLFAQSRTRKFSDRSENERREAAAIDMELRGKAPRQNWVAGLAADWFALRSPDPLLLKGVSTKWGIFAHDDVRVAPWLLVSGSARLDRNNTYGFFLSPRGSVRVRGGQWASGISADHGYFAPTAITEETEAAGGARLSLGDSRLQVEKVRSVSADVTHETRAGGVTLRVFQSHIDHPVLVDRATFTLRTSADPVVTQGVEFLGTARRAPFSVTATYTLVLAREGGGHDVALTPRHRAGLVAAAEAEDRGRVGVHVYYTDAQRLDANPYRSKSAPYVVVGLLAEHRVGRFRVFVNAENLTDVRQTRWDPIARPARDVDGRWTVDAWAPLAGRVINVGIRIPF